MAYSGKFKPKNLSKYKGDWKKIKFRSLWERATFRWCDANPNVIAWNSEGVIIPYFCPTDNKMHKYYMDLMIEFKNGDKYLIEVKPSSQTKPPSGTRKTKRFITESMAYVKNTAKWHAAKTFAEHYGFTFEIWTEFTLNNMGIPITINKKRKSSLKHRSNKLTK
jgi:hypothetical protein